MQVGRLHAQPAAAASVFKLDLVAPGALVVRARPAAPPVELRPLHQALHHHERPDERACRRGLVRRR
eukprot:757100-Prymnesium_polylepis.1